MKNGLRLAGKSCILTEPFSEAFSEGVARLSDSQLSHGEGVSGHSR